MPHDHAADGHARQHGHQHDHGLGHDHAHVPPVTPGNERKVLFAFLLTFAFMGVEAVGGVLAGSLALIADAGHMLTDAAALALAYGAFRVGRRPADPRRTFGYLRFEVVAGLANAAALLALVAWIGWEAFHRFRDPQPVLAGPMLAVAVAGLLVNLVVLRILSHGDSEHVNIKGATLHVMGDLLGSVGAIVAAVVIHFTGWAPIDPLLSVLVSLLILRSAWTLLRNSLHILLEGAPEDASPEAIEHHLLAAVPGLVAVSHVHVWLITSGQALATLHVTPAPHADPRTLVRRVEHELVERFRIGHATVAIDWNDEESDAACCSLSAAQRPPERG